MWQNVAPWKGDGLTPLNPDIRHHEVRHVFFPFFLQRSKTKWDRESTHTHCREGGTMWVNRKGAVKEEENSRKRPRKDRERTMSRKTSRETEEERGSGKVERG